MDGQRVAEDAGPSGALVHQYFQNDYQNSIGLVTLDSYVFGNAGSTAQNEGSDVFGQARLPNGAPDTTHGANDVTRRRYINQEDLLESQLIDLNARIYDPLLGKFMSPDPIISDQDDSQSWNAYAYSHNNPMSKEDPTGLDDDECNSGCLAYTGASAAGGAWGQAHSGLMAQTSGGKPQSINSLTAEALYAGNAKFSSEAYNTLVQNVAAQISAGIAGVPTPSFRIGWSNSLRTSTFRAFSRIRRSFTRGGRFSATCKRS
jgi:RHS repeat-associated protein